MAKPQEKFPNVFLACPFDKNMETIKEVLDWLPWKIESADKKITNLHLLTKISNQIEQADIALFDITGWNANVCLELGLAQGMGKKYYILKNAMIGDDAPSDIRGIERVEYSWKNKRKPASLDEMLSFYHKLKDGVFKRYYLSSKIWEDIRHTQKADNKFILILSIIAEFKGRKEKISMSEIKKLASNWKLNFKSKTNFDDVVDILLYHNVFRKTQKSGNLTLNRDLYR